MPIKITKQRKGSDIVIKNIKSGDKVVAKKQFNVFGSVAADIDDVFDVDGVSTSFIRITTDDKTLTVDWNTFEEYFDKYESMFDQDKVFSFDEHLPKRFTREEIEDIFMNAELEIATVFDTTTVVAAKLPNGFVFVESASSADPDLYDEEKGASICIEKIIDRLWEVETYRLKSEAYEEEQFERWMNSEDDCCDEGFEYFRCE